MITVLLFVGAYFLIGCVFCASFICRSDLSRIRYWSFRDEEIQINFVFWPLVVIGLFWKVLNPIPFIYLLARICQRVSGKEYK